MEIEDTDNDYRCCDAYVPGTGTCPKHMPEGSLEGNLEAMLEDGYDGRDD